MILINFGAHPTFNGSQADKIISADFPSPLRDYVSNIAGFEYNCYESQVCYYARGVAEQAAKDFVSMLEELK